MPTMSVYVRILILAGLFLPTITFVLKKHHSSFSRSVALPWNYESKATVFRRSPWFVRDSFTQRVPRALKADNKNSYITCGKLLTDRADRLCNSKLTATSNRRESTIHALCCTAACTDADIVAGNHCDVYKNPVTK
uniref:IlGF domain-containing protein n=1 Tax=Panagrellus redivivus TaxID=6233 RepID=A0A7E4VDM5_PANRE